MCSTLVPGPFPFQRHGKGPGNEVDSVLFRSGTSQAIYFFRLLSNPFPDFGSIGRSVGNEKMPPPPPPPPQKKLRRSLEPGKDKTWSFERG